VRPIIFPYIPYSLGLCLFYLFIYLAGCTIFPHLPTPIKQFDHYTIFFLQLFVSFQSSSINPFSPIPSNSFRPGKFRSTSFSSSRWTPFHNFFRQSYVYFKPYNFKLKYFPIYCAFNTTCVKNNLFKDGGNSSGPKRVWPSNFRWRLFLKTDNKYTIYICR
jgi:hypothetical protein